VTISDLKAEFEIWGRSTIRPDPKEKGGLREAARHHNAELG